MAKYDTYTLSLKLGDGKSEANLSLSVLFQDGDDIDGVIESVRLKLKTEALRQQNHLHPEITRIETN